MSNEIKTRRCARSVQIAAAAAVAAIISMVAVERVAAAAAPSEDDDDPADHAAATVVTRAAAAAAAAADNRSPIAGFDFALGAGAARSDNIRLLVDGGSVGFIFSGRPPDGASYLMSLEGSAGGHVGPVAAGVELELGIGGHTEVWYGAYAGLTSTIRDWRLDLTADVGEHVFNQVGQTFTRDVSDATVTLPYAGARLRIARQIDRRRAIFGGASVFVMHDLGTSVAQSTMNCSLICWTPNSPDRYEVGGTTVGLSIDATFRWPRW